MFGEKNAGVGPLPQDAVVQQAVRGREVGLSLNIRKNVIAKVEKTQQCHKNN